MEGAATGPAPMIYALKRNIEMAKYHVEFTCGHTETVTITGGDALYREGRKAWMEQNQVCPVCYRRERLEAEHKDVFSVLDDMGISIPALEGTEKQVAWAEEIRLNFLKKFVATFGGKKLKEGFQERFASIFAAANSAAFWIENRGEFERPCLSKKAADILEKNAGL